MEPIIRARYSAFALQERKLSSLGKKCVNKQNIMRDVKQFECKVFGSLVTFFSPCEV